ncbi:HNH endonuclease [Dermacoccus abyssi]|uniref:HNH endonuclease signature motif containing protein n=1 Tax=Dermacoccus abyssi TaxID=322596 RepID=UPI0021A32212|nr:HNH endonuclease [Dermacoccus abyssi]MCT1987816.1 HNH endonuclease [Dermacoccus abyssi]
MEQHLEITADAVSRMPREQLLAAWTVLTEAVVEQALVSVSSLLDLPEIGASLDERITESVETARQLEGAAAAVLTISRSADALVRVMAAEHAEAVRQVEALEFEHLRDVSYPLAPGEFAGDSFGPALGMSSGAAGAMADDAAQLRCRHPELLRSALRGEVRFATVAAIASELEHVEAPDLDEVNRLLAAGSIPTMTVEGARRQTKRLLRSLGLARPVDPVEQRREMGVWFSPHLEFDQLTEMRVVLDSVDAATVRAAIDARAQFLRDNAPRSGDGAGHGLFAGPSRADAFVDLLLGQATVTTTLHLRVPVRPPTSSPAEPLSSRSVLARAHGSTGCSGENSARKNAAAWFGDDVRMPFGDVEVPGVGIVDAATVRALAGAVGTKFVSEFVAVDGERVTTLATVTDSYRPMTLVERTVKTRDGHCRFPYCTRPADVTDVDHVIPFAEGGATSPANLQCLCRHHHRAKTFGGFAVVMQADGECLWESPTGHRWLTLPSGPTLPQPAVFTAPAA